MAAQPATVSARATSQARVSIHGSPGARRPPAGAGPTVNGRNGGGDRYFTDGELTVGVLAPEGSAKTDSVTVLQSPTPVVIKNQLWSWLRPLLGDGRAAPAPGERR